MATTSNTDWPTAGPLESLGMFAVQMLYAVAAELMLHVIDDALLLCVNIWEISSEWRVLIKKKSKSDAVQTGMGPLMCDKCSTHT